MTESPCLIDSNVWLYSLMTDPKATALEDIRKYSLATQLIGSVDLIVSTQVINEVCSVLVRKAAFTEIQIKQIIQEFYDSCSVVELDAEILLNASNLRIRYGFSFWDGLIVASALSANASLLYSEDMQDGLLVEQQLTIANPFR
jgi:predicted nucleic acid-binding protein